MILQFTQTINDEETIKKVEHIMDGVSDVDIIGDEIQLQRYVGGKLNKFKFMKLNSDIESMWLLNDEFKTLKRLI